MLGAAVEFGGDWSVRAYWSGENFERRFFGYSVDAASVSAREFWSRCRDRGFECRIILGESNVVGDGELCSQDAIVAWPTLAVLDKACEAAKSADWEAIGKLALAERVGVCVVEIGHDPEKCNRGGNVDGIGGDLWTCNPSQIPQQYSRLRFALASTSCYNMRDGAQFQ